jgi:hypothetical protein
MSRNYYPDLSMKLLTPLELVRKQLLVDPSFLNDPTCPYPEDVKAILSHFRSSSEDKDGPADVGVPNVEYLETETFDLYKEFKRMGDSIPSNDVSERLQYMKTRASLLEKLISMKERAGAMRDAEEFQNVILGALEDLVPQDLREEILQRLRKFLEQ